MKKINRKLVYSFIIMSFALLIINACKKDDNNNSVLTDIDGNVYHTVTIGTQVWMVENLKTTKFRDGTPIPIVTDNIAWESLTTAAYCNYNNDANNANFYGRLYNWYVAKDNRNIAPIGWHVPNDIDWTTLINYLGGENIAGEKMKDTSSWGTPIFGVTNSSGFTALSGGIRDGSGDYGLIGGCGYWWSANEYNVSNAHFIYIDIGNTGILRYYMNKNFGYSIRCVKD